MMGTLESTSTWYIFSIPLFTCMATVHQQSASPSASPGERSPPGADPADVQMLCLHRTISTQWALNNDAFSALSALWPPHSAATRSLERSSCTMRSTWRVVSVAVRLQPPLLRCQAAFSAGLRPATQGQWASLNRS